MVQMISWTNNVPFVDLEIPLVAILQSSNLYEAAKYFSIWLCLRELNLSF